jgi:hypothetical protein
VTTDFVQLRSVVALFFCFNLAANFKAHSNLAQGEHAVIWSWPTPLARILNGQLVTEPAPGHALLNTLVVAEKGVAEKPFLEEHIYPQVPGLSICNVQM